MKPCRSNYPLNIQKLTYSWKFESLFNPFFAAFLQGDSVRNDVQQVLESGLDLLKVAGRERLLEDV